MYRMHVKVVTANSQSDALPLVKRYEKYEVHKFIYTARRKYLAISVQVKF